MKNGATKARNRAGRRSDERSTDKIVPPKLILPAEAILTPRQAAAVAQISERQLERVEGFPWVQLGGARSRRVSMRALLDWMDMKASGGRS